MRGSDAGYDASTETGAPDSGDADAAMDPDAAASDAGALDASTPDALAGSWIGSYSCPGSQGVTGLTLDVADSPDAGLTAVFHFYADPSNPSVPSGSYEMIGTFDAGSRHLALTATSWIVQPSGWGFVNLDGYVSADGLTYAGTVPGCATFSVMR
jgi:hypothetical protein